jgi:choline dehydrogenase-like flavoprotein
MDQLPCLAMGTTSRAKGWGHADPAPADPFYGPSGGIFVPRSVGEDGTASTDFDFQFFGFGLLQPDADNRITLDPRRKDAWGIPVPHIRCKIGSRDRMTLERQVATLAEIIEGTGGSIDFIGSPLGLIEKGRGAYPDADPISRAVFRFMFPHSMVMGAAIHESGGARMGDSAADSVLNPLNQSWDAPNLFVTDASALVGSGVTGTTLTIMALTVRACRHLAQELRAGRL